MDGRAITEWDIIASNGIIHVISAPLKAPPIPVSWGSLSPLLFFSKLLSGVHC